MEKMKIDLKEVNHSDAAMSCLDEKQSPPIDEMVLAWSANGDAAHKCHKP